MKHNLVNMVFVGRDVCHYCEMLFRRLRLTPFSRNLRFGSTEVVGEAPKLINLTFIDEEGNRATVKARTGQTLLEAAVLHKVDIMHPCEGGGGPRQVQRTKDWLEDTFGEGPTCFACHVKIPSTYDHLLPQQFSDLKAEMGNFWGGEMSKTSRLACQITLESKHDGMVVFVPDPPLTDMCA